MSESQNIEYKESWHDEYLKWICGFEGSATGLHKKYDLSKEEVEFTQSMVREM